MSDQNPTTPDPSDAVPGDTPPVNQPPAYTPPPAPAPGAYPPAPPASSGAVVDWPKRAMGGLIDYVIPAIVLGVVGSTIGSLVGSSTLSNLLPTVLGAGWWAYLGYLSGTYGITPGRAIAKTKLVSEETGQLIGVGQGLLRQLGHVLDSLACYIGWLFPLWDAKRQTFADKIVKTVVVDNSADPNAGQIHWS